jgi:hypothetical protein
MWRAANNKGIFMFDSFSRIAGWVASFSFDSFSRIAGWVASFNEAARSVIWLVMLHLAAMARGISQPLHVLRSYFLALRG